MGGAPAETRTRASASGGQRDVHFTTGATALFYHSGKDTQRLSVGEKSGSRGRRERLQLGAQTVDDLLVALLISQAGQLILFVGQFAA